MRTGPLNKADFKDDMQAAHVIMVDDDEDDLFLTKLSFEKSKFPFKFTGLESADALFDYIETNGIDEIDILLLDLNMPRVDGLDALKKLQEHPEISKTKRFMYSTSQSHEDRDKCL